MTRYRVTLTPSEFEILTRPIAGNGGHQQLLRDILAGLDPLTAALDADRWDLEQAAKYASAYGGGGFQGRFKTIVSAFRTRAGWVQT